MKDQIRRIFLPFNSTAEVSVVGTVDFGLDNANNAVLIKEIRGFLLKTGSGLAFTPEFSVFFCGRYKPFTSADMFFYLDSKETTPILFSYQCTTRTSGSIISPILTVSVNRKFISLNYLATTEFNGSNSNSMFTYCIEIHFDEMKLNVNELTELQNRYL